MTYIRCGVDGWCYCFNVIGAFTGEWISYIFDTATTAHTHSSSISAKGSTVCKGRIISEAQNRQRYAVRQSRVQEIHAGIGNKTRVYLEEYSGAKRTYGVFSRNAQERICLAARVCAISGRRGRFSKGICRLQQEYNSLRIGAYLTPDELVLKLEDGNK